MIEVSITKAMKRYDGGDSLAIRAEFASGTTTLVTGPSGAGKTTLLRLIAGLTNPDHGHIRAFGQLWTDVARRVNVRPQRRSVGFVFQDFALFPHLTVMQHLQFGTDDQAYIEQLLAMTGLGGFVRHRPLKLSGGQRQRLGIARALSTKPRLLLMDEPFSALDPVTKLGLQRSLKHLFDELGMTCILVSHQEIDGKLLASRQLEIN